MSYRRLGAPGVDSLLGAGVFYGATTSEGTAFAGEHVFLAGGANSAGQAAVNLARYAQQVTIVVRGDSLAARMSQYLIDEIGQTRRLRRWRRLHRHHPGDPVPGQQARGLA